MTDYHEELDYWRKFYRTEGEHEPELYTPEHDEWEEHMSEIWEKIQTYKAAIDDDEPEFYNE